MAAVGGVYGFPMSDDGAPHSDQMLRMFNEFACGDLGVTMGLTLFVRGTVVSGVLIGSDRWMELWEQAVSVPDNEQVSVFTRSLRTDLAGSGSDTPVHDGHVHLSDAVYVSAGKVLRAGLKGLWRGRLSEVSGWGPGNLTLE